MVGKALRLVAGGVMMHLHIKEPRWCEVELQVDGRVVPLGADSETVVCERLLRGLTGPLDAAERTTLSGVSAQGILSLSERHCTMFATDVQDGRRVLVQGAEGELIADFVLSSAECSEWGKAIREW